jgi:hypothetical protein
MAPGSAFPEQHAASIVARTLSTFNTRPAAASFRPTRKPALFAVLRVRDMNRRWLVEEGLGLGPDVGFGAVNDHAAAVASAGCALALTDGRERSLHVIPLWGLMLAAARSEQGRERQRQLQREGLAPDVAAALASTRALLTVASPRAAALVAGACTYGRSSKSWSSGRSGAVPEIITTIGDAVRGGGSGGAAVNGAESDDDSDLVRKADADVDGGGGGGNELGPSGGIYESATTSSTPVGLAGLVQGLWEVAAAKLGIDVRCQPLLAPASAAAAAAANALEDDIEES